MLTLVFLIYHLLDAMVQASFDPQSSFGIFLRRITGLGERAIERIGLIFRTVVDLVLVIGGIPLLLLLWTLNWVDLRGLINTLALGITIGDVTILPGTLAIMLAILVAGVVATKLSSVGLTTGSCLTRGSRRVCRIRSSLVPVTSAMSWPAFSRLPPPAWISRA